MEKRRRVASGSQAAGISKVVIGQLDPHAVVAGKGRAYLVAHGVEVITGCLEDQVGQLNPHYDCFYTQQRPWVTLKTAMTLDGKINDESSTRTMISNHESYVDSQRLRTQYHALLIGERTLEIDDPQLTVRLTAMAHPPVRLVLLNTSAVAQRKQLLTDTAETWLLCRHASATDAQLNELAHVHVSVADWTPAKVRMLCVEQGWQSLLVEGGAHIQAQFIEEGLVDEWISYMSPTLLGGTALPAAFSHQATVHQLQFDALQLTRLGADIRIRALRKVDA
ncbi:bifunctional diaminohydroxyphosphoribosylaminopyrimidine deaminase/5-amino-6-(5-phosphoribosylamino)uracil reductase RibD [Lactiplantibacillus herbarum]|uniref:bifunctional diaminohydroxyphosphoribosylaminopyrimidine deaminase/5-amino-6-(5-phosphoribosylamino)uracil reductase RibD n=1 Tax=Lactiplantibacillus herbarum TaxID=1670446 RepID=UPI001ED991B8|nr:bifunctional diaminohydroxyphosphoribosylaminopyrimidine deaminase/5-amino-6-(5-phosphoribosylamino)uracil reductase RibD [Lactiplantibacillus herbarum]